MIRNLGKLLAFLKRDFQSEVSYRLSFLFGIAGILLSLATFYHMAKMIDPKTKGLDGVEPFPWLLVGLAFQYYFSTALFSFSGKIRNEQLLGTLEALLVSPTPTSLVIFSSAAWDFTYGAIRVIAYLLFAKLVFGVTLHAASVGTLSLGILLTLLSSAGLGILSASFILYFKRGDPINFFLSGLTLLFGTVFFPAEQLGSPALRALSSYLPVTSSLAIVRGTLLQGKGFHELHQPLLRLTLLTAVLLPLGLVLSRFAIRNAKREGSLVQY